MTLRDDGGEAGAALEARAMALAEAALDLPAGGRRDFIHRQTEEDEPLRARALALVAHVEAAEGTFLTGGGAAAFEGLSAPERIGHYRIEREIGRGGMGAVWLGRRVEADFEHVAAIKLVSVGPRGEALKERLRAERRLLARLRHPNIAQFHDGGETEDGDPYFIMEYVEGAPLHRYLEEQAPPLDRRLEIFRKVCEAVAYAHRNLVIHRDLSPANILVTEDGLVKVIDFGVSHTIGTDEAAAAGRMMTAGYAAPERRRGEPATTLADIYSLGVILAEMTKGVKAPRTDDLAAVAAKAASEEAGARHGGVEALIEDIDRYEAGRAVSARAGWPYAARRFIGRHRLSVAAGALAALGLLGASVVMSVLYVRAEQAEAQATQRFDEVRDLARFMLFDLHDEIAGVPGTTRAREKLADTSRRYLDTLSATPGADDALKLETAIGYKRLADVVGVPIGANLGRREEAGELLVKASNEIEAHLAAHPEDPAALRALGEAAFSHAIYNFIAADDSKLAIGKAREAVAAYDRLIALGAASIDDRLMRADALVTQGEAHAWENEGALAVAAFEAAQGALDELIIQHPEDPKIFRARAEIAVDYGDSLSRLADFGEGGYEPALESLNDGVRRYRALFDADESDWDLMRGFAAALWKRARVTYSMDREEESVADLVEAEGYAARLIARDAEDLGAFRFRLILLSQRALSLAYLGRTQEAEAVARESIDGRRRLAAMEPDNPGHAKEIVDAASALAEILEIGGDMAGACAAAGEAADLLDEIRTQRQAIGEYAEAQFAERTARWARRCAERGLAVAALARREARIGETAE